MKFRIKTYREFREDYTEKRLKWHRWFAWRPVRMTDDEKDVRWLEFLYRKGKFVNYYDGGYGYKWIYADNLLDVIKD